MTLHFYEVICTTPFVSLSLSAQPSSTIPDLQQACFTLFPYIALEHPYHTPSKCALRHGDIASRFERKPSPYKYLQSLSVDESHAFLESYRKYKHPSFGRANPTDVTNPFYQWVMQYNLSANDIRLLIKDTPFKDGILNKSKRSDDIELGRINQTSIEPDHSYSTSTIFNAPLWCGSRMGQSQTHLSDGRVVLIGGEYEDYYNPDFCIYNDVIIQNLNGESTIYRYPKSVFPPTDFHSATLIKDKEGNDDCILIIGSLGYHYERQYSHTPIYRLDLTTFKIEPVPTRNSMGWIHDHRAQQKGNTIVITDGKIIPNGDTPIIDNIDTWALNLNTLRWKNLTNRDKKWERFSVRRQDGQDLSLWYYQQLKKYTDTLNNADRHVESKEHITNVTNINEEIAWYIQVIETDTGQPPNLDLYQHLLIPPIDHTVSDSAEPISYTDTATTLVIDDIAVVYKVDDCHIQITIKNENQHKLSEDKIELLQQNLRHKLAKLENAVCEVVDIAQFNN